MYDENEYEAPEWLFTRPDEYPDATQDDEDDVIPLPMLWQVWFTDGTAMIAVATDEDEAEEIAGWLAEQEGKEVDRVTPRKEVA